LQWIEFAVCIQGKRWLLFFKNPYGVVIELLRYICEQTPHFQSVMPTIAGDEISGKEKKIACRERDPAIIMNIDSNIETDE
jgi:hypothetical protein